MTRTLRGPLVGLVAAFVLGTVGCSRDAGSGANPGNDGADAAQSDRFSTLAGSPFEQNRPTQQTAQRLQEELIFQRATQTYLWALPLLNTMGMRDGFAKSYSPTYNTMAIWTKRLDARTRITTPNSDLIYGMVFVNLADTGPLVFEAPPRWTPKATPSPIRTGSECWLASVL